MLKHLFLVALLLTASPALATPQWEVVKDQSKLTFSGTQMGGTFAGEFKSFTPVIVFDAANLAASKVTVDVDLGSIDTGDGERDNAAKSADWFDTKNTPTAHFESTGFTKTGDNAFEAAGNLTIRGATVPVILSFTLDFSSTDSGKQQAVMKGHVTLDRSKFKLGQGEWADPGSVGNDIAVEVSLTAIRP